MDIQVVVQDDVLLAHTIDETIGNFSQVFLLLFDSFSFSFGN